MKSVIVIPARLESKRLPRKPLLDINGVPMLVRVARAAQEADCAPILIAAAEEETAQVLGDAGFEVMLTDPDWPSGSDRAQSALEKKDGRMK